MRRECQVKSFDGLGPFSYVCRMMRFSEPNTNEFEPEEGSVYSERCVGDQHYVCVVNPGQQNPERVRGFPVEIDVEKGENDAGENIFDDDDLDSGYVPTTPPKSDQGSDREQAPKRPRDVAADERVAPGLVIRMIRMIRMGRIPTIPFNGTSQNWRETFCFSTRAGDTGPTTVAVMPVCKPVGGHQLVAGSRRQKKVDRQLNSS